MASYKLAVGSVTCLILLLPLASTSGCTCPLSKSKVAILIQNIKTNVRLLEDHLLDLDDNTNDKVRSKRSSEPELGAAEPESMEDPQTGSDLDPQNDRVSNLIQAAEDKILKKAAEIIKTEVKNSLDGQKSFREMAYADVVARLVSLQKNQWKGINLIQKLVTESNNLVRGNLTSEIRTMINQGVTNITRLIHEQASTANANHLEILRTQNETNSAHSILKETRDIL